MSLQSSISQQLHNTIANKQTSTQEDFVTITNIINNGDAVHYLLAVLLQILC